MSQAIRKYEGGGKSPQEPELFEWKDVNKYNKSDVVAGLYRNIDTYIQHNGLSGDKANQFRKSANQFIEGIKNGTVTMNGDGTFTDASGTMSSTGKYDKKFLGMGTKNTENNAFNRVGDFASSYIKSLSPYKAQEAAKPAANAKPIDFRQRLANIAMGGTWNSDVWRKFNSQDRFNFIKQAAQASHNDFLNNPEAEFNKDVFGTRDNWIERSSGLLKALEDGKYDPKDLKYSAAMGYGDLGDYLNDVVKEEEQKPEGVSDAEWTKLQEAKAAQAKIEEDRRLKGYNSVIEQANNIGKPDPFETAKEQFKQLGTSNLGKYNTINTLPEFASYDFDAAFDARNQQGSKWDLSNYLRMYNANPKGYKDAYVYKDDKGLGHYVDKKDYASELARELDYYIRSQDKWASNGDDMAKLERLSTGEYVIPHTFDPKTGLIRVYDRNKRALRWVHAYSTATGQRLFKEGWERSNADPLADKLPSNKEGGVVKAQSGTIMGYDSQADLRRQRELYAKRKQEQQATQQAEAIASGKSKEQAKNDAKVHNPIKDGFSSADKLRLASIGGDVLSLIASMSGVGSIASAGIGAASTGLNHAADMQEGMSWGKAFINNAGSYALDALSLIPFAKAAKVPKMLKTLTMLAPAAIGALGAMNTVGNVDSYINTWKKIGTDQKFTVEDWRNIASSIQLLTGTAAGAHRYSTSKRMVNAARSNEKQWLSTSKGNVVLDNETISKIRNAKNIEEANKILNTKVPGATLSQTREGLFRKKTGKAKVETDDYYDLSQPVELYSFGLPYSRRFGPGEKILGNTHFSFNIDLPKGLKDSYNKTVHPKAYKKAQEANRPNKVINEGFTAIEDMVKSMDNAYRNRYTVLRDSYQSKASKYSKAQSKVEARKRRDALNKEIESRVAAGSPELDIRLNKASSAKSDNRLSNQVLTTWATNQPYSKQPLVGAARANKEKTYRDVFQPVAEREYNAVWDEAIKGKKDFGYEDVTPRRSIYAPPVTTEITVAAPTQMTDKNARYLWELINTPKRSTAHVKREPPKKQTKPKAKKTSKDDRVTKKAIGGTLVPKYQGGRQMRNVLSLPSLNWEQHIAGSQDYADTIGGITPANAAVYNNMQGKYSSLGLNKPASNITYEEDVAKYQGEFENNTSINNAIGALDAQGIITGRGGSSDKGSTGWQADGLAGTKTQQRHLGANNVSDATLQNIRSQAAQNGLDVVKNLKQGMLNFMPALKRVGITSGEPQAAMPTKLTSPVNNATTPVSNAPSATKSTPATGGTITPGASPSKKGLGFNILPEDVIALGRMVGGLHANNKAAKQYKAGLKPLLIDTYENTVPIQGNLFAKMSADKQASDLTSLAARPRTSDASLQLAGQLEAQNKAGQMRFQGDMADADMFYKTRMLAQQESDAAKARRTEVANRNRASMLQIDAAKAQIDAAKTTANYQQVINPYLSGIENQFRQNRAAKKQYEAESYRQGLLANMQPQWDAATKAGDTAAQRRLMREYNTNMLNYSKDNVGMPWMFQKKTTVPSSPQWVKQGGRLTPQERIIIQRAKDFNRRMLQDNKQFHKDIVAAKKQHADLIKHMSSLTAELIKKGMSWK